MTLTIDTDLITVDKIRLFPSQTIETDMVRLDKIHPQISGNKWFKLKFHLQEAIRQKKTGLLSLGGPWSNHLHAVAAISKEAGLKSIGIIRGEVPSSLSFTLADLKNAGMQLEFVSRTDYRNRDVLLEKLSTKFPGHYIIDEGGQGFLGIKGAAEIKNHTPKWNSYTHILCAVGTGTMLAGLASVANNDQKVIGISSLKSSDEQTEAILRFMPKLESRFIILNSFHFGGFARHTPALIGFMNEFYQHTGIPTDIVYTAKLVFAWKELTLQSHFPAGSRVLLIHSGGLQGNRSLSPNILTF